MGEGREEVPDHLAPDLEVPDFLVEKTALRRAVIPSNRTPGFPLAEPTEVSLPGRKAMWREGRTANTQG